MIDRGIARHEYACCNEAGEVIGVITSGSPSPTLGQKYRARIRSTSIFRRRNNLVRGNSRQKCKAQAVPTPFTTAEKDRSTAGIVIALKQSKE